MTWKESVKRELDRYDETHEQATFTLEEFYAFAEARLAEEYPDNDHVQAKIRQILQRLRDDGDLEFVDDDGTYRIPDPDPADTTTDVPPIPHFHLNHPKNYFGYTLAVAVVDDDPTTDIETIMAEENVDGKKITSDVAGAKAGARQLDLIVIDGGTPALTELGFRVVAFAKREHGSIQAALEELRSFFGSAQLFVEALPAWAGLTQEVLLRQPGISRLVKYMQALHDARPELDEFPLPVFVQELYHRDPAFTKACFIDDSEVDRLESVSWYPQESDSTPDILWDRTLYHSSSLHQLKSLLCHGGILTTKGAASANLTFHVDSTRFRWGLTPEFRDGSITVGWTDTLGDERGDPDEQARDASPPEHVETTTSRVIRNTSLVKSLKSIYDYRCQVCGDRRQCGPDQYYAEGHHLHPLGEDGPDVGENILVLCPTCHADFDYGMVRVNPDTFRVEHSYDSDRDGATLTRAEDHALGRKYIEYHNQEVAGESTTSYTDCSICGAVISDTPYPNRVCDDCDERAVNADGERPWHGFPPGEEPDTDDNAIQMQPDRGENPVFIDGHKCWRRYRFGGWVTMKDEHDCETLQEFYEAHDML